MVREITAAPSHETARKRIDEVIEVLDRTHPKVSRMLDEHGEDILTVYQLPIHHRRSLKLINMLERYNQESCLRLVTAMAMEMS